MPAPRFAADRRAISITPPPGRCASALPPPCCFRCFCSILMLIPAASLCSSTAPAFASVSFFRLSINRRRPSPAFACRFRYAALISRSSRQHRRFRRHATIPPAGGLRRDHRAFDRRAFDGFRSTPAWAIAHRTRCYAVQPFHAGFTLFTPHTASRLRHDNNNINRLPSHSRFTSASSARPGSYRHRKFPPFDKFIAFINGSPPLPGPVAPARHIIQVRTPLHRQVDAALLRSASPAVHRR